MAEQHRDGGGDLDRDRAKEQTTNRTGQCHCISVEFRNGHNGAYQAVTYNRQAQQFIVDNMEAIMELAEA